MDITPQNNTIQPISDDQELAKALAGVLPDEPDATPVSLDTQFEVVPSGPTGFGQPAAVDTPTPVSEVPELTIPDITPIETPTVVQSTASGKSDLEGIKSQALTELRPLIDRVDLPAEERFDAYLMLLRSTDDSTLVAPAHAAAQSISDEKRKAEALLEIIKEIDYLSRKSTQTEA